MLFIADSSPACVSIYGFHAVVYDNCVTNGRVAEEMTKGMVYQSAELPLAHTLGRTVPKVAADFSGQL